MHGHYTTTYPQGNVLSGRQDADYIRRKQNKTHTHTSSLTQTERPEGRFFSLSHALKLTFARIGLVRPPFEVLLMSTAAFSITA